MTDFDRPPSFNRPRADAAPDDAAAQEVASEVASEVAALAASWAATSPSPGATERFGAALGRALRPGDVVFLIGPLGAGKSTLARALIRGWLGDPSADAPSPTFTLAQTYERDGLALRHADLYRLTGAEEAEELGLFDDPERAITLIEWPDRLGALAPARRLEIALDLADPSQAAAEETRAAALRLIGEWPAAAIAALDAAIEAMRVAEARRAAGDAFLGRAGWGDARRETLAGDASNRRYDRLTRPGDGPEKTRRAVLMDADPARGEDVAPFQQMTALLRAAGLSAPRIHAADREAGFLLLEDLGDALFARVAEDAPAGQDAPAGESGLTQEGALYAAATDLLAGLRRRAPTTADLPPYDAATLRREAALLSEWWIPAATGAPAPVDADPGFLAALDAVTAPVAASRDTLVLRDYHAENLIWLPERVGDARVGLLDYQDALIGHPAYDLVSLLEDARRDVAPALAERMIARYLAQTFEADRDGFRAAYAILGAQRNCKIIGIFARLWLRDGKDKYLAHIPRVWEYLRRDLAHPALAPLKAWIDAECPAPTPETLARVKATPGGAAPATPKIDTAMVLAAGLGTRMRPLTDVRPKPLIKVAGRTLLDRTLDRLREIELRRVVVNAHYLADQIEAHLAGVDDLDLRLSDERAMLLETGGGVAAALPKIARRAFVVVNADNIWTGDAALAPLTAAWDPARMGALLLLTPIDRALGYHRAGDFFLEADGRLRRRGDAARAPFVYTGAQIIQAEAFDGAPATPFSLNRVWDRLIAEGRAYGVVGPAGWVDVGTPAGVGIASAAVLFG